VAVADDDVAIRIGAAVEIPHRPEGRRGRQVGFCGSSRNEHDGLLAKDGGRTIRPAIVAAADGDRPFDFGRKPVRSA
jgi:hypothetical protein